MAARLPGQVSASLRQSALATLDSCSAQWIHAPSPSTSSFSTSCSWGAGSTALVMASLGVVGVFLVLTTRPRTWLNWTIFVLVWIFCCFLLPMLWRSTVSAFLVFIAFWMFRFAGVFGAAVAAIKVLDVTQVGAVLTRMHCSAGRLRARHGSSAVLPDGGT